MLEIIVIFALLIGVMAFIVICVVRRADDLDFGDRDDTDTISRRSRRDRR